MYPREEVQPAAKIDNGQPEPQNKGGPSSGSGGGVETGESVCSLAHLDTHVNIHHTCTHRDIYTEAHSQALTWIHTQILI